MTTYTATIRWIHTGEGDFARGQYSRAPSFVIASVAKQSSFSRPSLDCRVAFGPSQ
jgi:hypothetical protein